MLGAKSLALVASTSDPTPVESSPDATPQALLEVGQDGVVVWASPEATVWWGAGPSEPLKGRALPALFAEFSGGDAAAAGWVGLQELARGAGARLTVAASAGPFAVRVLLAPKGEPDASGRDTYIVAVERITGPDDSAAADRLTSQLARRRAVRPPPAEAPLEMDELLAGNESLASADSEDGSAADEALIDPPLPEPEVAGLDGTSDLGTRHGRPRLPGLKERPAAADVADALRGSRIGFFHIDLVAGAAHFSESWKALLGYEGDDVADEPDSLAALIHPEDSEASPLAARHRGAFSAEIRLRAKDDAWRWMLLEGVCSGDGGGKPARIEGIMLDVQERHEAEEETARNEERFLKLSGRGTGGFFELDFVADRSWYSPEFRRTLGRSSDELGRTVEGFAGVLPPEDARVGVAAFFNAISRGLPSLVARYQLIHAEDRPLDLDVLLSIRRNRKGLIEHVSGIQCPATAGREDAHPPADAARSAAPGGLAAAIQQALDAALEPIVLLDPNGLILHANARAATLAGQQPDRLATRPFHEVFKLVLRESGAPASQLLESALRGGQPLEVDQSCQLVGAAGPEDVALSSRPVLDESRRHTGTTLVLRRLADLPLTQAELVKSNRMEALGRLACGIVHDFNNLLTTVVGGVSLALDKRDLTPLETALKACNNAKNLARQLLTFARGDVTGRRVQSLNDIIRETARMAGAGSKSSVELELAPDLHPVNVVTSQLVQVFTNLILNAMQVMPSGGRIWVRTFNMPLGQVNSVNLPAGDYVRTDVQDNGPGIPQENLSRIFEPFFTTRADGTGLGLAMVNSIVAQHEGAIEASSEVGKGSTFTLYFPRAQTELVQEAPQKLSISYGSGRVLVMDDDPDLCAIASGMLDMLGYQAETATTADETIAKFKKTRDMGRNYSAVILDLTMAGGPGGEDVVGKLREIDPAVRAIVSSGYATEEHAEHYRKLGFVGMLSKPYRSGDLGRVLKEVLGDPK